MSKIGIMGGTFNPIHLGHIMLAKAGYQQFQLDKVLVIPNKLPAYKDTDELLDSKHRSRMVQIAIQDYPYMEFSDMELRRTGATYTIDTLRELSGLYPNDQFYFILGGDSLVHLREWREYQEILKLAVILCAKRNGADMVTLDTMRMELLQEVKDSRILFLDTPMMDISSTDIRDNIQEKDVISQWLPDGVYQYIEKHQLYMG